MSARQIRRSLMALLWIVGCALLVAAPGLRSSAEDGLAPRPLLLSHGEDGVGLLDGRRLEINGVQDARPVAAASAARPAGLLDDVLESQDFEGDDFPPEGWRAVDDLARQAGGPERYVWAIQDLETPRDGGRQAPWSIGGGSIGSTIGFGGVYTSEVGSVLAYGPMDLSAYPEGVTVQHQFYPDLPVRSGAQGVPQEAKSFLVCTERRDSATNLDCRTLSNEDGPRKQWVGWQEPLEFTLAGGMDEVFVYFIHQDAFPTGEHMGVIVDSVEIVGRTTSDPGPGPSPAPSATPRTDPGPGPGPGPGPVLDGRSAFLPMVFKNFDKADFPEDLPTPLPGRIEVHYGTAINSVSGALDNESVEFNYGIQSLCARERWQGLAAGTEVRVQWYRESGSDFEAIDPANTTGINPTFEVDNPDDFTFQCIGFADGSGNAVPVPLGRYRTSVYLRGEDVAAASRTALVRQGAPVPSATPNPNPGPTATATPVGEATAKPTLPANCSDPLVNGDFEQGPNVGWQQQSANQQASILPEGALESSYGVLLGLYPGASEAVMALEPVTTFAPGELESATVKWWFRVVSDEVRGNGDDADNFIIGVRGNTSNDARGLAAISEDSAAPGSGSPFLSDRWYSLQAEITSGFEVGEGFDEAHLIIAGQLNANPQLTNFRADNIRLELCTPQGLQHVPMRSVPPTTADAIAARRLLELSRTAVQRSVPIEVLGQQRVADTSHGALLRLDPRGLLERVPSGGVR